MRAVVRKMKKFMVSGLMIIDGGCQTVTVKLYGNKCLVCWVFSTEDMEADHITKHL